MSIDIQDNLETIEVEVHRPRKKIDEPNDTKQTDPIDEIINSIKSKLTVNEE